MGEKPQYLETILEAWKSGVITFPTDEQDLPITNIVDILVPRIGEGAKITIYWGRGAYVNGPYGAEGGYEHLINSADDCFSYGIDFYPQGVDKPFTGTMSLIDLPKPSEVGDFDAAVEFTGSERFKERMFQEVAKILQASQEDRLEIMTGGIVSETPRARLMFLKAEIED